MVRVKDDKSELEATDDAGELSGDPPVTRLDIVVMDDDVTT